MIHETTQYKRYQSCRQYKDNTREIKFIWNSFYEDKILFTNFIVNYIYDGGKSVSLCRLVSCKVWDVKNCYMLEEPTDIWIETKKRHRL